MKKILIDFKNNLSGSFKFDKGGYSARKLTSATIILMVVIAHLIWLKHCFTKEDFSLLSEVLIIDYGFVAALLGMTTYSQNVLNKQSKHESTKAE
jgi:hypothetical protein